MDHFSSVRALTSDDSLRLFHWTHSVPLWQPNQIILLNFLKRRSINSGETNQPIIGAIKLIRERREIAVKETTDLMDAYVCSQPTLQRNVEKTQEQLRDNFMRWLIWFIILAVGRAYILLRGR